MNLFNPEFFDHFTRHSKAANTYNIVGFDTEDDTRGTPMSFAFYDGGRYLKNKYFYTTDWKEAIRFVYEYPEQAAFVAHNLEYDVGNLFKLCDFVYVDESIERGKMLRCNLIGTKNFFMNSHSFFSGKLAKMGDLMGIPKLDGDDKTQLNPAYVIQDARIPFEFVTKFQKKLNDEYRIPLTISIGSIAMNTYRKHYMLGKKQMTYNNPELMEAYYGGRVEVFYKGIIDQPVTVSDINSSYPNVMRNKLYPHVASLAKGKIDDHEYGVGRFKVHVPASCFVPILPYRSEEGKLFFPVGTIEGSWTYHEVREAVKRGAKILKQYDGVGTNVSVSPFQEFVDHFYNLRKDAKILKKRDPGNLEAAFDVEYYKLVLNNLYGKFSEHSPLEKMVTKPLSEKAIANEFANGHTLRRVGPFYRYIENEGGPRPTSNFIWGVYVTSYARLELAKWMYHVHEAGCTLVYCDTDSIMYLGNCDGLPVSDTLGELDKETYDAAIFRQAKGYLLLDKDGKDYVIKKVACKGVPTDYAYDFIIDGMATFRKPMRLKEAVVRYHAEVTRRNLVSQHGRTRRVKVKSSGETFEEDIGVNVWNRVTKEMRSVYIKRKGETGVTTPVDVEEIEALEENSYQEPESLQTELSEFNIALKKKERKEFFANVTIPKNWFKQTGIDMGSDFRAKKLFWLNPRELDTIDYEIGRASCRERV